MNRMIAKKLFLIFPLLLITILFIALPQAAHAQIPNIPGLIPGLKEVVGAVQGVSAGVGTEIYKYLLLLILTVFYGFGWAGGLLLMLSGALADAAISFNMTVLNSVAVNFGFEIMLSLVNLLFVLAIIIIAFSTILRFQTYGAKQLLGKLIIAALLINFSLVFAGFFLDFSHVTTRYLLGGETAAADGLATALNPQQHLVIPEKGAAKALAQGSDVFRTFNIIIQAVFSSLFTWLLGIVMAAVAFLLFSRYFTVLVLLIFMPIIWFFWIVPKYGSLATKWWDKFLQQIFMLPALAFFVFLAISLHGALKGEAGDIIQSVNQVSNSSAATAFGRTIGVSNIFNTITGNIVVAGLLIAGLIFSEKTGIHGAGIVTKLGQGIRDRAIGAAGKIARSPAALAGFAGTGTANILLQKGGIADKTADFLSRNRLTRNLGGLRLAAGIKNVVAERGKTPKDIQQELSADSNEALMLKARATTLDRRRQAAYAAEIAKRGLVSEFKEADPKQWETFIGSAKGTAAQKDIIMTDPRLAGEFHKDEIGAGKRFASAAEAKRLYASKARTKDMENWTDEVIEDIDVLISTNMDALNKVATGRQKQVVRDMAPKIQEAMETIYNTAASQSKELTGEEESKIEELERLFNVINGPGWQR